MGTWSNRLPVVASKSATDECVEKLPALEKFFNADEKLFPAVASERAAEVEKNNMVMFENFFNANENENPVVKVGNTAEVLKCINFLIFK